MEKDKRIFSYYSKFSNTSGKTRRLIVVLTLLFLFFIIYFIWHTVLNKKNNKKIKAIPVVVAQVQKSNMPLYVNALGNVSPLESVTVRTQVNGQLMKIHFKDGQIVQAGDLLAEIDPRPYEAQKTQYEGQLARDSAFLANARVDLERYKKLLKEDAISEQILATQESLVKQYEGAVKFDEGQLQLVNVNLNYTRITSPIQGVVGLRFVDPGNYLQTSDQNGIVIINTLQPINVLFTIPEDYIPFVMQKIKEGNKLVAQAFDRSLNKLLAVGYLTAFDNKIDPLTGTIKLKARFENKSNQLFPNQFVNIRLLVDILKNITVVPTQAIQQGNRGSFVYIVDLENKIILKNVKVRASNNEFTAVSGVELNQLVVTEGVDKLKEGSKVNITKQIELFDKTKNSKSTPSLKNPNVLRNAAYESF